jgi:hypothetical protein
MKNLIKTLDNLDLFLENGWKYDIVNKTKDTIEKETIEKKVSRELYFKFTIERMFLMEIKDDSSLPNLKKEKKFPTQTCGYKITYDAKNLNTKKEIKKTRKILGINSYEKVLKNINESIIRIEKEVTYQENKKNNFLIKE